MPTFIAKIKQMLADKERIILVTHQANRLSELLGEADIIAPVLTEIKQTPPARLFDTAAGSAQFRLEPAGYPSFHRRGNFRVYQAAAAAEEKTGGPA